MSENSRSAAELAILRALISLAECGPAGFAHGRMRSALATLARHKWDDEERRVVYECLNGASRKGVGRLREEMAAEAVRMGHPDVDWDAYFRPLPERFDLLEAVRSLDNTP